MLGQMMTIPLLISSILKSAERHHANAQIVSVTTEGPLHRYPYRCWAQRSRRLAKALAHLGAGSGDRAGTLAWNGFRHLEIYYATSGSGLVCHTINPRLFPEQIAWIVAHAADRWVFVDITFVPLLEQLAPKLPEVESWIVMTDRAHMPQTTLANVLCYEELIDAQLDDYEWPTFDENTAAALCYTSGTTGDPKGVLYSHRSSVLHAYALALPDSLGLSARDVVLPIVPMFHVNAWGIPYAAPMVGASIVLPGPKSMDGATLQQLIEQEGVTASAGVPTVWMALLAYLDASGRSTANLDRVIIGGSAASPSMIKAFKDRGIRPLHGWGMTEMSPLGAINTPKPSLDALSIDERSRIETRQGRALFGVEMKVVDENGEELPWNGESAGALKVRGPWVIREYYRHDAVQPTLDAEGWFDTGDIATIDPEGYLLITDRAKDIVKSGGEWISSIELENLAAAHPAVGEAAVIGVSHPKWGERPLLLCVLKAGACTTRENVLEFFAGKVARWWLPDDVVFVESLPHTATGKLDKKILRKNYANHLFCAGASGSGDSEAAV